ncbi:hypothetical protein [Nonomuraea salmonea]|uniref:hypothetical protein n=1 Tax=Nonomuraea salmonea TaxID=46181 RepID=UPI0031E9131C
MAPVRAGQPPGGDLLAYVPDDVRTPVGQHAQQPVLVHDQQVRAPQAASERGPRAARRGEVRHVHRGQLHGGCHVEMGERRHVGHLVARVEQRPDLPVHDPGVLGMMDGRGDTCAHVSMLRAHPVNGVNAGKTIA